MEKETLEAFIQALQYEITEFESKNESSSPSTREDWFEALMSFFEYNGLGNMQKAVSNYNESIQYD